jgi:hypothetical protein
MRPISGKTIYLYLRLVKNLLRARPCLYQTWTGRLLHISENIVSVPDRVGEASDYGRTSEALVDLDGAEHKDLVGALLSWPGLVIIIATSPNPTLQRNSLDQVDSTILAMDNWSADEFWVSR